MKYLPTGNLIKTAAFAPTVNAFSARILNERTFSLNITSCGIADCKDNTTLFPVLEIPKYCECSEKIRSICYL